MVCVDWEKEIVEKFGSKYLKQPRSVFEVLGRVMGADEERAWYARCVDSQCTDVVGRLYFASGSPVKMIYKEVDEFVAMPEQPTHYSTAQGVFPLNEPVPYGKMKKVYKNVWVPINSGEEDDD